MAKAGDMDMKRLMFVNVSHTKGNQGFIKGEGDGEEASLLKNCVPMFFYT